MSAVLELDDVRKSYPGPVDVLHGVSLVVREGELAAVVGPSGLGQVDAAAHHGHARARVERRRARRRARTSRG